MKREDVKKNAYSIGVTAGMLSLGAAGSNAFEKANLKKLEGVQADSVGSYYKNKKIGRLFEDKFKSMPDSKKKKIMGGKKTMHGWKTSKSKGQMEAINNLVGSNKRMIKGTKNIGRIGAIAAALALATGGSMSLRDRG